MTRASGIRTWNPQDDNMADMAEVEVFEGGNVQIRSLRDLDDRELLILLDACREELQMRGVEGV